MDEKISSVQMTNLNSCCRQQEMTVITHQSQKPGPDFCIVAYHLRFKLLISTGREEH